MKVLIVDDSSFKRKALAYLIEKQGHEVMEAGDGQDGLEKARAYIPDIIVSDILMPRMDGFNFLRNIKKDEQLRAVPFVFYSSIYTEKKERELALSLGASGFIADIDKPESFWQEVQEIIAGDKEPQVIRPIIEEDEEFLKNYGQIVAAKLEEKVRELEEEINRRRTAEELLRESEEKFSLAFHSSPAMIALATLDGKFVDVNMAFADFHGYSREEMLGKSAVDLQLISEESRQKMLELARKGDGSVHNAEIEIQLRDDGHHHVLFSLDTLSIGGVPHRLATLLDITERKRIEEELRLLYLLIQDISLADDFSAALEVSLRKICETTGWVMGEAWVPSADKSYLECSPAWYGGFEGLEKFRKASEGVSFQPGIGLPGRAWSSKKAVWDTDVTLDANFPRATYAKEAGLMGAMAIPILAGDEVVAVMDFFVLEPREEDRRLVDLVSTIAAYIGIIFQRKQAEAALLESETRFRATFEQAAVGIALLAPDGRWLRVNQKLCNIVGYQREELLSKTFQDITHPDDLSADLGYVRQMLAGELQTYSMEKRYFRKDGSIVWIDLTVALVHKSSGEPDYFISVVEEITMRKQAEEEFRKLHYAVEQNPASIFITDAAFNIEYINPKFTEVTGYSREEAIGKKPDILTTGTATISDTEWRGEFLARKKNGDPFWEYATISPIRNAQGVITNFIGIHEDITERRKLEEQLRHSQKLEAIGQLVGGIAHDFNNMLTAIIGFAGILQMKMKKDDPLMVNVEQVLEAAERGAGLTRSLLVFGRKQTIYPSLVNLNDIVEKVKKLLSRLIGEGVELRTVSADKELTVMADSLQIEQILMNLATNARDAMQGEGTLTIETRRVKIDKTFIRAHGYGEPGDYALISVSDTGAGMDEKTRARLFEPFFTTKEVGKGTGLGLAIVYGIVKQHNGFINVYSEVGKGTIFNIYLPLTKADVKEAVPAAPAVPVSPVTGTETILVAEDDAQVRRLSKTLLETFGYKVIEAVNGEEAVQKYLENKDTIQLLVLDVIMPRKNGREAYEQIKKISPAVKVIFMSGYTADIMHTKGIIEKGLDFVSKPVLPAEFIKKVREVLDR